MTKYTIEFDAAESTLTDNTVEALVRGALPDTSNITITREGETVHVDDSETVLTGVRLPEQVRENGCPECGSEAMRTTAIRAVGESYTVGSGDTTHVGTDGLVQFGGFSFAECHECAISIIEDAEVVYEFDGEGED